MKHLILLFIITSGLLITATGCSNGNNGYEYYDKIMPMKPNVEISLIDGSNSFDFNHDGRVSNIEYLKFIEYRLKEKLTISEFTTITHNCTNTHDENSCLLAQLARQAKYFMLVQYILAKRRLHGWSRVSDSSAVTESEVEQAFDELFDGEKYRDAKIDMILEHKLYCPDCE